jgi:hypothetical protein
VLKLAEIESPEPRKPHDVLIRLRAGGVNPADCQARTRPFAGYVKKQVNSGLVLGMEGAASSRLPGFTRGVWRHPPLDAIETASRTEIIQRFK